MLDNLFAEHSDDQEFAELAGRYFRDKVSTTEEGEIIYDLTLDEQREAAEEYIAYIAQRDVKPSWWKQFIQAVRTFFKGFYSLDMSDSDIETLIGRAAAKTRRNAWNRSSRVVKENLTTGNLEGQARFAVDEDGTDNLGLAAENEELLNKAEQLKNNIITEIDSNVIKATADKSAIQSAMDYVESLSENIFDTEIGKIKFDSSSVKESLSHTIYQNKLDAIQAVPDILTKGVYLGSAADKDGKPIVNHYFAGKVNIGDNTKIVFVRTKKSEGRENRFYVHEVFTEDEITKLGSQQTDAALANTSRKYRNASEFYRNIIAKVLNYKPENQESLRFSVAPDIDTPAFKNWFAESKVVDEDGKPMVVYHGSSALFWVFDHRFGMRNGAAEGRGFYFSRDKNKAAGYKTENGKLFEVYLRLQKPLSPDELTITKSELEKIIRAIDTDGTYVSDYAEDDIGYPGKTWYNKAVRRTVNAIYDSSDNNADIVAEIYSVFGQGDALAKITEATGYDGFIKDDVYVVFNPTQIKSATDNIGTFDPDNPDIRFSVAPEETEWEKAVISVLRPVVGESVEMDKAEIAAKVKELYGLDLSPDDAKLYAYLAAAENRKANASRQIAANKKRAFEYFEDLHSYFYHFRKSGEGLYINPGKEFEGEEVSGTFISENFRKYSVKRAQRKNESDKQYRKYLQKRREKLDSAEGVSITDLAESYARATGSDPKTVEKEMFDFFRDLTVKDILSAYKKHKQDLLAFDKAEDARLRCCVLG